MLRRATARTKASASTKTAAPATTSLSPSSVFHATDPNSANNNNGTPNDELIERVRLKIPNAHVFKLPPKPSSGGWRGADWRDKVWQGTLKVVERGEETAVLLVDANEERNIFAVCPIRHNIDGKNTSAVGNGIDRCIDSSRYFVLRIQNAQGRHMFIGLAFNERNDAFDFNTALEDSRREKELERKAALGISSVVKGVDYGMKEGEKIRVSIPTVMSGDDDVSSPASSGSGGGGSATQQQPSVAARRREARKTRGASGNTASGGFLKPSSKDTPSRLA
ncbi:hypothetical protein ACHAXR_009425 [Thalassiosira sp. AJA248-18]